jgi:glutathione-regulated potassium-efflux system ancillary protein KefC
METHAPTWLINTFIYLSAAVVAVPLSQALGLGSIIGYLAAGMAIGPWGLGLVTNVEDILHFAEFGVVLMLFLVGLELEPKRLWSLRRPIFGWGSAQVLGCTAAIFALALAAGAPWRVALVAGMGLALSSTAIALQVMNERNLMRTGSGQAGFSILLFQDIAAIPILALLPLLGQTLEPNGAVAQTNTAWEAIKIVAVIGGIVLGGRIAIRPVFRWIARSRTPEIFTAASLLLVVGIAGLMQFVGLSMALGAFLAGVLLAESEYRRELETNIEPFKGLLLGLFFIAVGMGIDFGVLARNPLAMVAIVLGFLAAKAAVIYAIGRSIGLPFQERPVFTLLLAQGGEFAFVVFQAAEGSKVFSAETSSLLVGAVAVSMLVSPLILVAMDRWLLPRYAHCGVPVLEEISEQQDAPVIIAGMGRYGQIIARVLIAQGYNCTVLDHDAEMIETARRVGYRVFYGDATRLDLLRTAGIAKAKLLVVAVDNVEQSLKVVDLAKEHYPDLPLVARARDVTHWNQLRDRGVMLVQREMFESSLASARSVLEILGQTPEASLLTVNRFRQHNLELFEQLHPHYKDSAKLMSVIKQGRQQFEEQMARERQELAQSATPHASLDHLPGADVGNAGGGGVLGGGAVERMGGGGGAAA